MRALVVYESMYGNTRLVADAIARGLTTAGDVTVLPIHDAGPAALDGVDLVVVGGPTHVHGMSRPSTRKAAVEAAGKDDAITVDPDAAGDGVREWLAGLPALDAAGAAFDTRLDAPAFFTGRASKGIARELRHHGMELLADPESFLVTKESQLEPHEEEHAAAWGARLADQMTQVSSG